MSKQIWKPGNLLYPLPAVLVSCADKAGNANIMTAAWTGTICSDPVMVYVSIRPERHSHHMVLETGEYVLNLTNEALLKATDWCGIKPGKSYDKWKEMGLTKGRASALSYAPVIEESPVSMECRVTEVKHLGSHDMFMAEVVAVQVDESLMDEAGRLDLKKADLIEYIHGEYLQSGAVLGKMGFSVKKK